MLALAKVNPSPVSNSVRQECACRVVSELTAVTNYASGRRDTSSLGVLSTIHQQLSSAIAKARLISLAAHITLLEVRHDESKGLLDRAILTEVLQREPCPVAEACTAHNSMRRTTLQPTHTIA